MLNRSCMRSNYVDELINLQIESHTCSIIDQRLTNIHDLDNLSGTTVDCIANNEYTSLSEIK